MNGRILIIEDVREDSFMLKSKLMAKEFQVLSARTENEFWEHMSRSPINLVIFDVCLEKRLSPDVYHALLDLRESRKIPVIFIAGVKEQGGWVAAVSDENYIFFPDPVCFDQLHLEMQRLLGLRQEASAA